MSHPGGVAKGAQGSAKRELGRREAQSASWAQRAQRECHLLPEAMGQKTSSLMTMADAALLSLRVSVVPDSPPQARFDTRVTDSPPSGLAIRHLTRTTLRCV